MIVSREMVNMESTYELQIADKLKDVPDDVTNSSSVTT